MINVNIQLARQQRHRAAFSARGSPSYRITRCRFIAYVAVWFDMFARWLVNTRTAYSISIPRRSPATDLVALLHPRPPPRRRLVLQSRTWLSGIKRNMTNDARKPGRVAVCQICSGEDVAYNLRISEDIVRRAAKAGATVSTRWKSGLVRCCADLHAVSFRRVFCQKRPTLSFQLRSNAMTFLNRYPLIRIQSVCDVWPRSSASGSSLEYTSCRQ